MNGAGWLLDSREGPIAIDASEIGPYVAVSSRSEWSRLALRLIAVYVFFSPSGSPSVGRPKTSPRRDQAESTRALAAPAAGLLWSAATLGSDRGQAGLAVAAIVVSATLLLEFLSSGRPIRSTLRAVGLGKPRVQGLAIAAGVCGILLLVVPTFALATGSVVTTTDGWLWLVPGLFAQAGVAEETLFRGYLFGRLRIGRTFWRAATLSMLPFVAVHLVA